MLARGEYTVDVMAELMRPQYILKNIGDEE